MKHKMKEVAAGVTKSFALAVALTLAGTALADTWTDPDTGIEWCYTVSKGEAKKRLEAHGDAKSKRETMIATAKRMLESGMLALNDIAMLSVLSLLQVRKLQVAMPRARTF